VPYKFGAESSRGAGFGIRSHPSLRSAEALGLDSLAIGHPSLDRRH